MASIKTDMVQTLELMLVKLYECVTCRAIASLVFFSGSFPFAKTSNLKLNCY